MSYGNYYEGPPRRRTSRALVRLAMLVWLLVFSCVGLRAFAIPAVNDFFYRQVNRVAEAVNPDQVLPLPSDLNPVDEARERVEAAVLPSFPPLPTGTFTITNDQATGYLNANRAQLGVDSIAVQFVPGEVLATLTRNVPVVGSVSGTARTQPQVVDGRVELANPQLDPPLGSIIEIGPLVDALENRLNQEAAGQNKRITSIVVEQGEATFTIE